MANSTTVIRQVLFGDCDPEGIVYTPRFSDFALEATHEAMSKALNQPSIRALKEMGVLIPVRAFNLEFLSPVTWDQNLELNVQVSAVTDHSFSFLVEGYAEEKIKAFSAEITYVTVSSSSKKKIALSCPVLEMLDKI